MKKSLSLVGVALAISLLLQSCIGSFALTNKALDWNRSLGNKFVQEVVFIGMNIIPVYGVCVFGDAVILNLVEFWTGSNPMAMEEGDSKTETITKDGIDYQLTATQNNVEVEILSGENEGETMSFSYDPAEALWCVNYDNTTQKIMQINSADELLTIFNVDGSSDSYGMAQFSVEKVIEKNQSLMLDLALR